MNKNPAQAINCSLLGGLDGEFIHGVFQLLRRV